MKRPHVSKQMLLKTSGYEGALDLGKDPYGPIGPGQDPHGFYEPGQGPSWVPYGALGTGPKPLWLYGPRLGPTSPYSHRLFGEEGRQRQVIGSTQKFKHKLLHAHVQIATRGDEGDESRCRKQKLIPFAAKLYVVGKTI